MDTTEGSTTDPTLLSQPLDFIDSYVAMKFTGEKKEEDPSSWEADLCRQMKECALNCSTTVPSFSSAPSPSPSSPPEMPSHYKMIHFRGMVKDMGDPQFYPVVFHVVKKNEEEEEAGEEKKDQKLMCGMFRNIDDVGGWKDFQDSNQDELLFYPGPSHERKEAHNQHHYTRSRLPLLVSTPAGESEWFRGKKKREEGENKENVSLFLSKKREGPEDEEEERGEKRRKTSESTSTSTPTPSSSSSPSPSPSPSPSLPSSKSIPDHLPQTFLVYIYQPEDAEPENIKLNEIYDFYGVLFPPPSLSSSSPSPLGGLNDDDVEWEIALSKQLPSIHCVAATPLPSLHQMRSFSSFPLPSLSSIRNNLLGYLSDILHGDKLTAEFLLLHLVSSVHQRRDGVVLGPFPLNICNIQRGSKWDRVIGQTVRKLVSRLVTYSVTVPHLNANRVFPKKDHTTSTLSSAFLQLGKGTNLILNEKEMMPGQLLDVGVKNIRAFNHLIKHQKVEYDFDFGQILQFDNDIPVLSLSTSRSIFSIPFSVKLNPSSPLSGPTPTRTEEAMWQFRLYISHIQSKKKLEIEEEMSDFLQSDYVELRKANPKFSSESFSGLLSLSRILAVSHGEETLTKERWTRAKEMQVGCLPQKIENAQEEMQFNS